MQLIPRRRHWAATETSETETNRLVSGISRRVSPTPAPVPHQARNVSAVKRLPVRRAYSYAKLHREKKTVFTKSKFQVS